jgi:hypothetical protein
MQRILFIPLCDGSDKIGQPVHFFRKMKLKNYFRGTTDTIEKVHDTHGQDGISKLGLSWPKKQDILLE